MHNMEEEYKINFKAIFLKLLRLILKISQIKRCHALKVTDCVSVNLLCIRVAMERRLVLYTF